MAPSHMTTTTLKVEGMTCGACTSAVESGLQNLDGVLLGGESGLRVTTVKVGGMTCGACTSAVEGAFKNVAGVKSFSISLLSERAVVEHDTEILTPEQIAEMIEDTGFDAEIVESKEAEPVVGDLVVVSCNDKICN